MSRHVLMPLGDFVGDYDAMAPKQVLLMQGPQVDVARPCRKPGEPEVTAIHDFERYCCDRHDMVVIPGGRKPDWQQLDVKVMPSCISWPLVNRRAQPSATAYICSPPYHRLLAAGPSSSKPEALERCWPFGSRTRLPLS